MAGLWESWRVPPTDPLFSKIPADETGSDPRLESATIITTVANEIAAPIHDRMPVLLHPDHYDLWLNPAVSDQTKLLSLLRPYPSDELTAEPLDCVPTP